MLHNPLTPPPVPPPPPSHHTIVPLPHSTRRISPSPVSLLVSCVLCLVPPTPLRKTRTRTVRVQHLCTTRVYSAPPLRAPSFSLFSVAPHESIVPRCCFATYFGVDLIWLSSRGFGSKLKMNGLVKREREGCVVYLWILHSLSRTIYRGRFVVCALLASRKRWRRYHFSFLVFFLALLVPFVGMVRYVKLGLGCCFWIVLLLMAHRLDETMVTCYSIPESIAYKSQLSSTQL